MTLVNRADQVGSLLRPPSVTQAYATKARERGGKIYHQTEVVGLALRPDGTWEVTVRPTGGGGSRTSSARAAS